MQLAGTRTVKKVRQYFSVIRYGEEQPKQLAFQACLAAERRKPVYAETLENRKALVQRLIIDW
jgi:hypothetical protein